MELAILTGGGAAHPARRTRDRIGMSFFMTGILASCLGEARLSGMLRNK
jgi:hypothetical protein